MGYKYIKIKLPDGTTRDEHRLVMEKIIGRKLKYNEVVHHKDENGKNNDPSNLEIKTRSKHTSEHFKPIILSKEVRENKNKKLSDLFRGSKSNKAILTESDVVIIKNKLKNGEKSVDIADEFGVSPKTIGSIKQNHTWIHVVI